MEAWELHTSSRAVQGYVSFAIVLCITLSRSLFFNIKLKKNQEDCHWLSAILILL